MFEMPASRRKSTRYPCTGGVEMRRSEGVPAIFGNLTDVSLEGCYVETPSPLPVGNELVFQMRVRETMVRGRARVKASHHAVGMGLEFLHLSSEDQQKLEFLVGMLAGKQEMRPPEKRAVVPEDPIRIPAPLTTPPRPINTNFTGAAMRVPAPSTGAAAPAIQSNMNSLSHRIAQSVDDLNGLEQELVKERVDPRLLAQFHDAIGHIRQTAWTLQQWVDLESKGGDPFEVLPQLEGERMQMLGKLAHNVTADIDSTSINQFTLGVSELYETIQHLYRRLHKMLVDEAGG
jgi:hypothetical protein